MSYTDLGFQTFTIARSFVQQQTEQDINDTRLYTVFLPLVTKPGMTAKRQIKIKLLVADFVSKLPGFVEFYGGDSWISDPTLGCLAYFANGVYAGAAVYDIETEFGALVGMVSYDNDTSAAQRFQAASIAFLHTPSATHFVRLETAMREFQAEKYPIGIER